jgi:hypothetical protein
LNSARPPTTANPPPVQRQLLHREQGDSWSVNDSQQSIDEIMRPQLGDRPSVWHQGDEQGGIAMSERQALWVATLSVIGFGALLWMI